MRWTFSLIVVSLIPLIRADGCEDAKPDFSAPGQRICEQKCHEYNWERKKIAKCSKDAANTEFSYMGALGYKNKEKLKFLCGGFLISPKFALTAAHCINVPSSVGPLEVIRFGNKNLDDNVPHVDAKVLSTIVHPQFQPPAKENDIALVEIESELPFTKSIHPACLWSQATFDGVDDTFSPGWPRKQIDKKNSIISALKVKIMDKEQCKAYVTKWAKIVKLQESQICVNESISGVADCNLTPAPSPLVTQFNLGGEAEDQMPFALGMVSFGEKCGGVGVYTRIYSFIDWIEKNVWK